MRFLRRHWYDLGLIPAALAIVALVVGWRDMDVLRRLLLLNFVVILLHQYEEYGWPGGEPAIMNLVIQPSTTPDRYPLNQNSAMLINVLATYGLYLVPVFFPRIIWLGLAPVLFGISQFIVHGIVTPRKMRMFYNPGLAAVVLGHIPIGAIYIYYIQTRGLAGVWDWVFAVAYMFAFVFITLLKMTYTWLADAQSPFVFDEIEMTRFSVREKMDRLRSANDAAAAAG